MMAATATFAAAVTEASAQSQLVLNNQLNLGDVVSGQTLNVENASEQVNVSNTAAGNTLTGGVQGVYSELRSVQNTQGDVSAVTELALTGDTAGRVQAVTQAHGNLISASSYDAEMVVDSDQIVGPRELTASSAIRGGEARLLAGGQVGVAATANTMALGGTGTHVAGAVHQTSDASVRASNLAETRYIPANAAFASEAIGNSTVVNGPSVSSQDIYVGQRSTGDIVIADTSANAGNAWDLTGSALANANRTVLNNQGGSVVARTQQENASEVVSNARVTSYQFGAAVASAQGGGNVVSVANNDQWLELDNSQINSGGVEVRSTFIGAEGYDAYVSADAVGNAVTGYACSTCQAQLGATSVQRNEGNISASAATTINGQGRTVITGATAVGNAATFYVTRPGQ
jgi:hypothetical protein